MDGDAPTMVGAYMVAFPVVGTRYFACSLPGHCVSNQKLVVTTTSGSGDEAKSTASIFASSIAVVTAALVAVTIW